MISDTTCMPSGAGANSIPSFIPSPSLMVGPQLLASVARVGRRAVADAANATSPAAGGVPTSAALQTVAACIVAAFVPPLGDAEGARGLNSSACEEMKGAPSHDYVLRAVSVGSGCRSVGHRRAAAEVLASVGLNGQGQGLAAAGAEAQGRIGALAAEVISGALLFDGHAEVMARRGLGRRLLDDAANGATIVEAAVANGLSLAAAVAEARSALLASSEGEGCGEGPLLIPQLEACGESSPSDSDATRIGDESSNGVRLVFAPSPRLLGLFLWVSQPPCGDCSIVSEGAGTGAHVLMTGMERTAFEGLVGYSAESLHVGPRIALVAGASASCGADSGSSAESGSSVASIAAAFAGDESAIPPHFCPICKPKGGNRNGGGGDASEVAPAVSCPWASDGVNTADIVSDMAPLCAYPFGQTSVGRRRTKAGAGVPTLSMCCTDKVARWGGWSGDKGGRGLASGLLGGLLARGPLPQLSLSGVAVDEQRAAAACASVDACAADGSAVGAGHCDGEADDSAERRSARAAQHAALARGLRCGPNKCLVVPTAESPGEKEQVGAGGGGFLSSSVVSFIGAWPHAHASSSAVASAGGKVTSLKAGLVGVSLNTKLGLPMGAALSAIAKNIKKAATGGGYPDAAAKGGHAAQKRPREEVKEAEGLATDEKATAPLPLLGDVIHASILHPFSRYAMAASAGDLLRRCERLAGRPEGVVPSTYRGLKALGGLMPVGGTEGGEASSSSSPHWVAKGQARDFRFAN